MSTAMERRISKLEQQHEARLRAAVRLEVDADHGLPLPAMYAAWRYLQARGRIPPPPKCLTGHAVSLADLTEAERAAYDAYSATFVRALRRWLGEGTA